MLHNSPDSKGLAAMLHEFQKQDNFDLFAGIQENEVAGDVTQYLHTEDATGKLHGRCTDIRYKYDSHLVGTFEEALRVTDLHLETRRLIQGVFERSGRPAKSFRREEFNDIVSRLARSPRRLAACFNDVAAQDESPNKKEVLQDIFRNPEGDEKWTPKSRQNA